MGFQMSESLLAGGPGPQRPGRRGGQLQDSESEMQRRLGARPGPARLPTDSARRRLQGPPTLTFSLVGGSSQLGPLARPGPEAAVEIVISQNVLRFVLWSF